MLHREAMYQHVARPLLFLVPPADAHEAGMAALAPLEHMPLLRGMVRSWTAVEDPRLIVRRLGLTFPNPIGLAAGFDKNARRARALAALGFGHVELGTVTALAQEANPEPNLFRLPADRALINRLGFPNEGAATVAQRLVARGGAKAVGVPVGLSIGKSRAVGLDPLEGAIADYVASFVAVRAVADFVVVNVSSPNTPGLRTMQGAELARALLAAITRENEAAPRRVPLLLKIAPDLPDADLEALLEVADATRLDGVVATNTTISRAGLSTPASDVRAIGAGGLSGPPLRDRALDVVRRVRARLGKGPTVIGVGGVETAKDAMALVRAGADLVQLYTGFIYEGPWVATRIARGMAEAVAREGATAVGDLVGMET
jgi:dihydroorotate dehydrogenase